MRLGLCTNPNNTELAARLGFDYVECGLSALSAMEEKEFQSLAERVPGMPLPILKCNGFLPGTIKLTGPDASMDALEAYVEKAFTRAHQIGIQVAVLGSGAARQVPEGWSYAKAWRQIADFLRMANGYCEKYGIDIALEPLRRKECNILNLVSEGVELAAMVDLPHIFTLGDTFHMLSSHEPFTALTNAGAMLRHVHISHPLADMSGRDFPHPGDGQDYAEIFRCLRAADYQGDVSIEAGSKDLEADGPLAVKCLKPLMED